MCEPSAAVAMPPTEKLSAPTEPSIVGTWIAAVSNGISTSYTMSTFLPRGQIIEDNSGTQLRNAAQGEWIKIGPSQYLRSMRIINFDAPRTFTGFNHITNMIQLNAAGDEYDAEGFVEVYDANGNLTRTVVATQHGRRCTAAMTMPQCMGLAPLTKSSD